MGERSLNEFIRLAYELHDDYVYHLTELNDWMGSDDNAGKLALFNLISDSIASRRSGPWSEIEEFPLTVEQMEDTLGPQYAAFEGELNGRRHLMELASLEHTNNLTSSAFKEAMFELKAGEFEEYVEVVLELLRHLPASENGLDFLASILEDDSSPLCPEVLVDIPEGFDEDRLLLGSHLAESMCEAFIQYAPAIPSAFEIIGSDSTMPFLRAPARVLHWVFRGELAINYYDVDTARKLSQQLARAEDYSRSNAVVGFIPVFLDTYNVLVAFQAWQDNPSSDTRWELGIAFAKLLFSMQTALETRALIMKEAELLGLLKYSSRAVACINVLTALYDAWKFMGKASDSNATGDDSLTIGYSLMAAGALSWGLAFAISGNIITIGALGGPAGWLAAGLGLLILGGAIVLFTRDTPIEQWLDNNYFGKAWDSNEFNNLNPKETSFRFRYEDEPTRPNFSRQVSAFFSVLSPMRLEEMIVGSRLAETDKYVIITMNPVLVDNDSFVMLTPYDENGVKIGENSPPITFDNHELHVQRTSMLEAGTDWFRPVQHSTNWICEFRIAAPGTGVDSSYGYQLPAGTEYVEVNLIPPDTEFETLDAMQQYAEYVPNIIRGRGAVPSR